MRMIVQAFDILATGQYRRLRPWDHPLYAAHLLRLAEADRRARFSGAVTDEVIERYARASLSRARSTVIGWFHGGVLRGAVEVEWSGPEAEAAFSVEAMHQRHGVGKGLMRRALRFLSNRGRTVMRLTTDIDNRPMRRLIARFQGAQTATGRDVEAAIAIRPVSLRLRMKEWAEECANHARDMLLAALPCGKARLS